MEVSVKAYRLTKDVMNPKPDRRSKDWHKREWWSEGERVLVDRKDDGRWEVLPCDYKWPTLHGLSSGREEDLPRWMALAPALEETPAELSEVLSYNHIQALEVLEELISSGAVTKAKVNEAVHAVKLNLRRCPG